MKLKHRTKLVKCEVCGEQTALSSQQYEHQLRFKCWKCNALRPIRQE